MKMAEHAAVAAQKWLGTPYRHQASKQGAGCDCLGLIRGVWRELYGCEPVEMPMYARDLRRDSDPTGLEQAAIRYFVPRTGQAERGDLVLFRLRQGYPPRHCGILLSNDSFIHAQERIGVVEAALTDGWRRRLTGAYIFPLRTP